MRKEKSEKNVGYNPAARFFLMLFFAVMAILILIPLYALLLGTFKGGAELFVSGLNLDPTPEKLHLRAWRYLFTGVMSNGEYQPHDYFIWYKNSFLLVLVQGTLTLLISSMVAYGFSKYQFRGKNVLFLCVLLVMMIPLEILMLPMYTQINAMGLRDSYAGVMLPFLANMSAIFFFKQFLEGVPGDLLDAGRVDGCTEYGIFFKIIMPIMKPAYASMAVLVGMGAWNGLLWPLLVISSMDKYTIPLGLNTLFTPYGNNYDLMITGSCFAILPLLLLYLLREAQSPSGSKVKNANIVQNENEIIRLAQQYVAGHIREKLSVPMVANQVGVSPSYLTVLFHKNLQISPGEYIRRIKLQESKQMIRENNLNFTQIAAILQYSTVHHFSRQFKDKFGITPTEYAKSVR